jgi:hypothetical protein
MITPHARTSDDVTSHRAVPPNINQQCMQMLRAYKGQPVHGLTAKEAEHLSGVSWRRSSDLLNWGLIVNTPVTRRCRFTNHGKPGRVRIITRAGLAMLKISADG